MALDQSALLDLLDVMRSTNGGDLMRRLLATMLQLLVDAEATAFFGAEPHQRSEARTNQRPTWVIDGGTLAWNGAGRRGGKRSTSCATSSDLKS